MNQFVDFARSHGLIFSDLIVGKWVRTPTVDKPKKRNGSYKFMGDVGFVQNFATQSDVSIWRPSKGYVPDSRVVFAVKAINHEKDEANAQAAKRAQDIVNQTMMATHPYLEKKGHSKGLIWFHDQLKTLVVPMRINKTIVGCQLIDEDGNKKFLKGQRSSHATFTIGKGDPILCEGYVTGLSISAALTSLGQRRSVIVCFSAGNMRKIAKSLKSPFIVADNDESGTGQSVAEGYRHWISDTVGEDFNDYHVKNGLFRASLSLKKSL